MSNNETREPKTVGYLALIPPAVTTLLTFITFKGIITGSIIMKFLFATMLALCVCQAAIAEDLAPTSMAELMALSRATRDRLVKKHGYIMPYDTTGAPETMDPTPLITKSHIKVTKSHTTVTKSHTKVTTPPTQVPSSGDRLPGEGLLDYIDRMFAEQSEQAQPPTLTQSTLVRLPDSPRVAVLKYNTAHPIIIKKFADLPHDFTKSMSGEMYYWWAKKHNEAEQKHSGTPGTFYNPYVK